MVNKNTPIIEMKNITKKFGDFIANDNINLDVKPGEIHALLGENGAGKSTLMNILTGLLQPTSGDIFIKGEKVEIESPAQAFKLGIGMVHQHFMLIDDFTVTENIMLGSEMVKNAVLDTKEASEKIAKLSDLYKMKVNPNDKVAKISVGQQQRVEILKTLYRDADILIFDEPTAVLTPQEIQELIKIMKNLAKEGKAIILITHKLDEIRQAADRVTVIRAGKSIKTQNVKGVSSAQLAKMMVGRSVSFKTSKKSSKPGATILRIDDLTVTDYRGVKVVEALNLEIRRGEIVGLAGIDGNGQTELVEAITGLTKPTSGSITLNSQNIIGYSPRKITQLGLGHIPEDRHRFGMQLDMSLSKNMAMQTYYHRPLSKTGILQNKPIKDNATRLSDKFDVRASSIEINAGQMSGGNQQKAVIARELDRDADLIIASQPTRGLDVGSIEYIHKQLINQRDLGKAVLVVSFELDEILNLSDRIAVISNGEITGIVDAKKTNRETLGLLMAGETIKKKAKSK